MAEQLSVEDQAVIQEFEQRITGMDRAALATYEIKYRNDPPERYVAMFDRFQYDYSIEGVQDVRHSILNDPIMSDEQRVALELEAIRRWTRAVNGDEG